MAKPTTSGLSCAAHRESDAARPDHPSPRPVGPAPRRILAEAGTTIRQIRQPAQSAWSCPIHAHISLPHYVLPAQRVVGVFSESGASPLTRTGHRCFIRLVKAMPEPDDLIPAPLPMERLAASTDSAFGIPKVERSAARCVIITGREQGPRRRRYGLSTVLLVPAVIVAQNRRT